MVGTTNRSIAAMSGAWLRRKVRHPWDGGPHRLTLDRINPVLQQYISLFTSENSLFRLQKFPVPLRREFDRNRLNFPDNRKRRSLPRVRIFKIPCYFPCYTGS